jgi:Ca2+-binding EF-hand superfamily protein
MLTDFQKRKLTRYFEFYDADNNGFIEQADYENFANRLAKVRGWDKGTTGHAMIMGRFMADWQVLASFSDADGDERVTLNEWFEYHNHIFIIDQKHRAGSNNIVATIFETLDINGDGEITENEFKMFYNIFGMGEAVAQEIFPKIDHNGDGILTRSEIATLYHQFSFSDDPDMPGNWLFGPF